METTVATARESERKSIVGAIPFRKKGVLLIDDDPDFRAIFEATSISMDVPLRAVESLTEMFSFAQLQEYDVIVVDYHLESFCGLEIAEYVDVFFKDLPVVLISGDEPDPSVRATWPTCIRKFVNKSFGPYAILQRTLHIFDTIVENSTPARKWSDVHYLRHLEEREHAVCRR